MPAEPLSSSAAPADLAQLLRSVSRSFDLSIRLLPAPLRRPVSVGYLLARAADTFADTSPVPADERSKNLAVWAAAVDGRLPDAHLAARRLGDSFAPLQRDPRERALILALPQCLAALDALPAPDQADVRTVMRHITRGQMLDVERFADASAVASLADAGQLDEYTYLVAGCVGEFWTDLCARHLPSFASLPTQAMRVLGRDYGQALQLVNILRDAHADAAAGRSYLPANEVARIGAQAVRADLLARARDGLEAGMRYADAVNSRRVRAASALPALIGVRTLSLMEAAPDSRPVKVARSEVRAVLLRLALTFAGRGPLRRMFDAGSSAA